MASNLTKTIAGIALATAVGLGTFKGTSGLPFLCNVRNENGRGIQAGLINVNSADFSGVQIGLVSANSGRINGVNISLINGGNKNYGFINGLEIGAMNFVQQGSYGLQLGILNVVLDRSTTSTTSWNPLFNVMNGYKPAQYNETNTVSGVKR